jgi:WXG100 family type VII secretion target
MGRLVRLDYDELKNISHQLRDEGEDIVQLQGKIRERVRGLHKDWEGEGAQKFFMEMDNDLLPALSRLSRALFFTQDTLQRIVQLIHDHDEDTKGFFKGDFTHLDREHPGATGVAAANSWERMDQYQAWDANRKEFVYPDNQLQPEQPGGAAGSSGGLDDPSGSADRRVAANEFTGEVSSIDVTAVNTAGAVSPRSSEEKESNNKNGYLPEVTTVTVER